MPQSSQLNDKKYPISLLTSLAVAFRSSGPEVFCKKCVFKNFAKLTGKHLRSATLLKKILWHRCFLVNFSKFLRTLFFHRTPPVAASGPSQQVQYIIKVLRITLLCTDSHNNSHNSCLINSSHMFSHHKVSQWYCGNGIAKGQAFHVWYSFHIVGSLL